MKYKNHTISEKLGTPRGNQSGLFTPYNRKFNLHLIVNGIRRTFTYQYNPSNSKFEKGDGIYAIALDAVCYMNSKSFEDFCNELGYENKSEGKKHTKDVVLLMNIFPMPVCLMTILLGF